MLSSQIPDELKLVAQPVGYTTTEGHQVIQRGNKRTVIHDEPPPKKRSHWLLFVGIGMVAVWLLLFQGMMHQMHNSVVWLLSFCIIP